MSRHDNQLAYQRANFERALKGARCPKDGGRVLEVSMPDVICSKCSTTYVLAMRSGTFFMRWKLTEKAAPQPAIVKEKEVITQEIGKAPCKYCGSLVDIARDRFCPNCGRALK
ncbi:MAG: hypothetical protein ABSG92_08555 [Conexivisphaerales archaeon]